MAKTTKKKVSRTKRTNKNRVDDGGIIFAATGILFAGACVILLGNLQEYENIQLLLIGFGAALLVLGGVVLGLAIRPTKK